MHGPAPVSSHEVPVLTISVAQHESAPPGRLPHPVPPQVPHSSAQHTSPLATPGTPPPQSPGTPERTKDILGRWYCCSGSSPCQGKRNGVRVSSFVNAYPLVIMAGLFGERNVELRRERCRGLSGVVGN